MADRDKTAIIIIGPESSGTKFLTKIFIEAGCYGDHWHTQRLDEVIPDVKKLVFRRSYPHKADWPDLTKIATQFSSRGYNVKVIVIIRSMEYTIASRKRKQALNIQDIQTAFYEIGSQLASSKLDFVWVTYEAILLYKMRSLSWLFNWAGVQLPPQASIKIKDGNKKHIYKNQKKKVTVKRG